jgi:hypothetical protein
VEKFKRKRCCKVTFITLAVLIVLAVAAFLIWWFVFMDDMMGDEMMENLNPDYCTQEPEWAMDMNMADIETAKILKQGQIEVSGRRISVQNPLPMAGAGQAGKLIVFPVADSVVVWQKDSQL